MSVEHGTSSSERLSVSATPELMGNHYRDISKPSQEKIQQPTLGIGAIYASRWANINALSF
jgi:hypothetical protein